MEIVMMMLRKDVPGVTGLTCAVHVVHLGVTKEPLVSEMSLCGGETRLALVNRLQHTPVSAQVSSPALASCHDGATPQPPEGERGGGRERESGRDQVEKQPTILLSLFQAQRERVDRVERERVETERGALSLSSNNRKPHCPLLLCFSPLPRFYSVPQSATDMLRRLA